MPTLYWCPHQVLKATGIPDSNFDQVSWLLVIEATELVSEPVTQMTVELINNHLHSSTAKEMSVKATFFFMKKPQQTNFEMLLKCC